MGALIAAMVGLLACAPAWALVLSPADDTLPSPKPLDMTIAQWGNNATCVPIASNYVMTTRHQGGGIGTTVVIRTSATDTIGTSYVVADAFDYGAADIRVCRITNLDGTPANLPSTCYTAVYTKAQAGQNSEVSQTAVIGGYGMQRGDALTVGGNVYGYKWNESGNSSFKWGANRINGNQTISLVAGSKILTSDDLLATFDGPGGNHVAYEAAIAAYDSGSPWFVDISGNGSGVWRVAGLSEAATDHGSSAPDQSWYGDTQYVVRVSTYEPWITGVLNRSEWTPAGGGNWSQTGNWSNGVQSGTDKVVVLGSAISADAVLTLDTSVTLGTLRFNGPHNYTINSSGGSGITFSATSPYGLLDVQAWGSYAINAPVTINEQLLINQNSVGTMTLGGAVSGTGSLRKYGPGVAILSGSSDFSGGVTVDQGTLRVTNTGGLGTGNVALNAGVLDVRGAASGSYANSVTVGGASTLNADSPDGSARTFSLRALTLSGDQTVTVTSTSGSAMGFTSQSHLNSLTNGATINTASGDLKLTGGLTFVTGSLTKLGSAALTIGGTQRYGTITAGSYVNLYANAGTTNFDSDAGPGSNSFRLKLYAANSAAVNLRSTQRLAALNLGDTSVATVSPGGANTVLTTALSIAGGAKLDLNDNNLIVRYSGASPLQQVAGWILSGMGIIDPDTGSQLWDGNGIISSRAALNPDRLGLGVVDNAYAGTVDLPRTPLSTLDGVAVQTNDVLVKYTTLGDIDLSGSTDLIDYFTWKYYYVQYHLTDHGGLNPANIGWQTGDFNMDGAIDLTDYFMWKTGYVYSNLNGPLGAGVTELGLLQGSADAAGADASLSGLPGAAPEPSSLALIALGMAAGLIRRRRGR
jgi:autotransporter-associated beta strand protein